MSEVRFKQATIPGGIRGRLINIRIEKFNTTVDDLARNLYDGKITLGFWEEEMRTQLRLLHTGAMAIGKGGWDNVTPSDWGKVGNILKEQYNYLHQFAKDIYDRRNTITVEAIQWRSKLYGEKAGYTVALAQALESPLILPWIPRDGSTACWNRCRCEWLFTEIPQDEMTKMVIATWTLNPAEHCVDCLAREGFQVSGYYSLDTPVPEIVGGF